MLLQQNRFHLNRQQTLYTTALRFSRMQTVRKSVNFVTLVWPFVRVTLTLRSLDDLDIQLWPKFSEHIPAYWNETEVCRSKLEAEQETIISTVLLLRPLTLTLTDDLDTPTRHTYSAYQKWSFYRSVTWHWVCEDTCTRLSSHLVLTTATPCWSKTPESSKSLSWPMSCLTPTKSILT